MRRKRRVRIDLGDAFTIAPLRSVVGIYSHSVGIARTPVATLKAGDVIICAEEQDAEQWATVGEYFAAGGIAELRVIHSIEGNAT